MLRSLITLLLLISLNTSASATVPMSEFGFKVPKTQQMAPGFSLENIKDGQNTLKDYAGKLVLLNFWATWCPICLEEMPAMQTLWEKYQSKGFVIVAVAADRGNRKGITKMADQLKVDFPVLHDPDGDVRNNYEVTALPMSYLISRDGKILGRIYGGKDWASPEAFAIIESLLAQ
jgi:peroxiredoxin